MEIIEKIRKEIERRREIYADTIDKVDDIADKSFYSGLSGCFTELLSFLDSLQEETPTDLEEEIVEYWKVMGWSKSISLGKFKVIARYFYGLGQNSK
jgi:hypothetical protein